MDQPIPADPSPAALQAAIGARLAAGELTVPVLPAVACSVLALLGDPDADGAAIAAAVGNDPALAGHVMKFANSPLLRAGAPIVSLQQAIARLGIRRIAEVALAACLGPRLFAAPAYAGLIERLWSESVATALWSREIARTLRNNVEVSFLCGLLHQIGHPVVLQAVQEAIAAPDAAPAADALDALLAAHGAAAGLVVANRWHLPDAVAETIGHVADFRAAARNPELVALVAAGRALALATVAGAGDADALAERDEMAEINLYRADIEALLAQAEAVRSAAQGMAA